MLYYPTIANHRARCDDTFLTQRDQPHEAHSPSLPHPIHLVHLVNPLAGARHGQAVKSSSLSPIRQSAICNPQSQIPLPPSSFSENRANRTYPPLSQQLASTSKRPKKLEKARISDHVLFYIWGRFAFPHNPPISDPISPSHADFSLQNATNIAHFCESYFRPSPNRAKTGLQRAPTPLFRLSSLQFTSKIALKCLLRPPIFRRHPHFHHSPPPKTGKNRPTTHISVLWLFAPRTGEPTIPTPRKTSLRGITHVSTRWPRDNPAFPLGGITFSTALFPKSSPTPYDMHLVPDRRA